MIGPSEKRSPKNDREPDDKFLYEDAEHSFMLLRCKYTNAALSKSAALKDFRSGGKLHQHSHADDAHDPNQEDCQSNSVKVPFCDTRRTGRRRNSATEHIGKAATLTLVHQNRQGQQNAGQRDDHDECNVQCRHVRFSDSFRDFNDL